MMMSSKKGEGKIRRNKARIMINTQRNGEAVRMLRGGKWGPAAVLEKAHE